MRGRFYYRIGPPTLRLQTQVRSLVYTFRRRRRRDVYLKIAAEASPNIQIPRYSGRISYKSLSTKIFTGGQLPSYIMPTGAPSTSLNVSHEPVELTTSSERCSKSDEQWLTASAPMLCADRQENAPYRIWTVELDHLRYESEYYFNVHNHAGPRVGRLDWGELKVALGRNIS